VESEIHHDFVEFTTKPTECLAAKFTLCLALFIIVKLGITEIHVYLCVCHYTCMTINRHYQNVAVVDDSWDIDSCLSLHAFDRAEGETHRQFAH